MLQIAVPRSVLIMSPILLMMIMGGSRLAYRAWKERTLRRLIAVGSASRWWSSAARTPRST